MNFVCLIFFGAFVTCLCSQQQLQALMETLNSTEPHYIRCVKPNSLNRPQQFENASVIHQLRCGVSILDVLNPLIQAVERDTGCQHVYL